MIPAASCSCQQIRSYAQNCSPPPFVAFSASFSFNRVVFYSTYLQKGILSRAWIAFSIPAPCLQKPIVITQITYLTAAYLSVLNGPSIDYNYIFFSTRWSYMDLSQFPVLPAAFHTRPAVRI